MPYPLNTLPYFDNHAYYQFPSVDTATDLGILAVGGDLNPDMLLSAYTQGVFPWFDEHDPLLWWAPDPRFVLYPQDLHLSKSLKKLLKNETFHLSVDTAFEETIRYCSLVSRPDQDGTWITQDMIQAYMALHSLGYAHSFEAWEGSKLVGGFYGVSFGNIFCGESMFALVPNASKYVFAQFVQRCNARNIDLIDSQIHTEHLERFGAKAIPRETYMQSVSQSLKHSTCVGVWCDFFKQDL